MMTKRPLYLLTTCVLLLPATDETFCQIAPNTIDVPTYYDPATGNVTIDFSALPSGRLFGYGLTFRSANFDPEGAGLPHLIPENFTPFMGSVWVTPQEWSVGESNFAGIPAGVYSLGSVLPAGLSRETGELIDQRIEGLLPSTAPNIVLGELGQGIAHGLDFVYGKSPFTPINADGAWTPEHERWAESAMLLYDPTDGGIAIDLTGEKGGAIATYGMYFSADADINVDN